MFEERIELTVFAKPTALSRQGRGQFGGQFKTKATVRQIDRIVAAWEEAGKPRIQDRTPLIMSCRFYYERPQSHFGTGKNAGILKPSFVDAEPISRPDADNLLKLVGDALSGYAFDDDARITEAHVLKAYAEDGFARTEIVIEARQESQV